MPSLLYTLGSQVCALVAGRSKIRWARVIAASGAAFVIGNTLLAAPAPAHASAATLTALLGQVEDVTSATGHRYDAKDDQGTGLDCIKVIPDPRGGYLGVYHHIVNGVRNVRLARSTDLLSWHFLVTLEPSASQPTIASLVDGGFLVSYEKEVPGDGDHVAFKYYRNISSLVSGAYQLHVDAPRTLAPTAEGTPNVYGINLSPDIRHSQIGIGFHYYWNQDVDREARGTLTNFKSWTTSVDTNLNSLFLNLGTIGGNIGDRDAFSFEGEQFSVHEAQLVKDDFSSWRSYIRDWNTNTLVSLPIHTDGGSRSFGNPTLTSLVLPSGRLGFFSTQFVFSEGAAPGEAGELIYFREYT